VGLYLPTEKNGPAADLYPSLGFARDAADDRRFVLDVSSVAGPYTELIEKAGMASVA
jgi:hypothetical protein